MADDVNKNAHCAQTKVHGPSWAMEPWAKSVRRHDPMCVEIKATFAAIDAGLCPRCGEPFRGREEVRHARSLRDGSQWFDWMGPCGHMLYGVPVDSESISKVHEHLRQRTL